MLYIEVKKAAQKGLEALKSRDYSEATSYFSFAFCNVMNIERIFERMESDNRQEWKKFYKNGTIEHIRMIGVKLSLLIEECQKLEVAEE